MNAQGFSRCSIVSTAATTSASPGANRPPRRVEIDLAEFRVDWKSLISHGVEAAVAVEPVSQQTPEPRAAASDVHEPPAARYLAQTTRDPPCGRSRRGSIRGSAVHVPRATLRPARSCASSGRLHRRQCIRQPTHLGGRIGQLPRPRRRASGQLRANPGDRRSAVRARARAPPHRLAGRARRTSRRRSQSHRLQHEATTGNPAASAST